MSTSLFAKVAIAAAAATMFTLSPALAHSGHHGHSHKIERKYHGHYGHHYKKKHFRGHRSFYLHRHWKKPRHYRGYGYKHHRRWY